VAGRFYSDNRQALKAEVERCFVHSLGPGEIPRVTEGERTIVGAVVPHASLGASGWVAAHAYAELARDGFPEAIILIGPNHHGFGSAVALTTQDFVTPLGTTEVHKGLARKLVEHIPEEPFTHQYEHSLEVQLPFIQYLSPETPFVPILMSLQDYETAMDLGRIIRNAIGDMDVVIIASSDFSHYVSVKEAKEKDGAAIKRILDLDPKGFYETVLRKDITICGFGPVMAMLSAVQGTSAQLLRYGHSGEVFPGPDVVGYAAIVVRR